MANFSLTVPDVAVSRIRKAFGRPDVNGVWQDASLADVQAVIKSFVIQRLVDYETTQSNTAKRYALSAETAAW